MTGLPADSLEKKTAEELLPIVYSELRKLAQARLAHLPPGQTLQPTALVHEAYMRLVGKSDPGWDHKGHFFGAAANAMRNILVDEARRKGRKVHGGDRKRVGFDEAAFEPAAAANEDQLLILDDALRKLEAEDPDRAQIVLLRYFAGLTIEQVAEVRGVSARTIEREWRFTRVWLHKEMSGS